MINHQDTKAQSMKTKIKYLLVLGFASLTLVGCATGRYQMTSVGDHALIIDTVTGKVWQNNMPTDGGRLDPNFYDAK
jgi:hypothetical protein